MSSTLVPPPRQSNRTRPLETGDLLSAPEFLRRYDLMPELKKAELIEGVVYVMSSPVSAEYHSEPDSLIQTWLGNFAIGTPGVRSGTNGTLKLDNENVPQPDAALRILLEYGGRTTVDAEGYLVAGPELIVEVTSRSASVQLRNKLQVFRRHGIPECLIWRTADAQVEWLQLAEGVYEPLVPDRQGILKSRIFPGLWLKVPALLRHDGAAVMATLNEGLRSKSHRDLVTALARRAARKHNP